MVRITIDDQLTQKLREAQGSIVLCDSSGKLLGSFTSVPEGAESLWDLMPEMTASEIDRLCDEEGPWLSTEEAKRFLQDRQA